MPTYVFRCRACGPFDRRAAVSAVPDALPCPTCGDDARRGVSAPALHAPGSAHRVAAAHERSAHAPDVVAAVPGGRRPGAAPPRPAAADPRHPVDASGRRHHLDTTLACLNAIEYVAKFGWTKEQVYLVLGAAPVEGRLSGVVDIPNSCATLSVPPDIFDIDVRPSASGPQRIDRGQCAVSTS